MSYDKSKERGSMTEAWRLYEQGRRYNHRLVPDQYRTVEVNTEFYIGNQWPGLPSMRALHRINHKPTFNILKRVASLFIASLTSSGTKVRVEPLAYYDGSGEENPNGDAAGMANAMIQNLWEKLHFDYRIRDALIDGAQTGDYCFHFFFDPDAMPYGGGLASAQKSPYRGEIQMEMVDGINVHFGNPNDRRVETQPYILIVGRDTVENLRDEARRFQKHDHAQGTANPAKGEDLDASFKPDAETAHFAGIGGKIEADPMDEDYGKCLFVYLYRKVSREETLTDEDGNPVYEDVLDEDGFPVWETMGGEPQFDAEGAPIAKRREVKVIKTTVHVTKATRSAVIYEDVDTGLSVYPIAWGNWEKQRNQYHGRALVTGLIPNQIFINQMFAMAMRHLQLMAFPKTVYNADLIPAWTDEIGQVIGVRNLQPGQPISQVAANLAVPEMSGAVLTFIDAAINYTKECLGATDVQMGNVRPDNTSAIMVLQTNAEVPLENIRAGLHEFMEQCGAIMLDMMGTYYGERPVVAQRQFNELIISAGMPQIDPMTGALRTQSVTRKTVELFDFSTLKHLSLDLRIDVGATTRFSEIAMTQTLDNLRQDGTLDVIQYLERVPDELIPRKTELLEELRGRIAEGQQTNAAAGAAIPQPGSPVSGGIAQGEPMSEAAMVQQMPGRIEAEYDNLPQKAKNAALRDSAMRT